jgi:hypothetical protein
MQVGDIVGWVNGNPILGQVVVLLSDEAIIETGKNIFPHNLKNLEVTFAIGDEVFVRDTNKSFVISDLVYSEKGNCWKAERSEKTSSGFHPGNNDHYWFNLANLEKGMVNYGLQS